jgi:hypothetical protein
MTTTLTTALAWLLTLALVASVWADCAKRVDDARDSIKQAEAAVGKATDSGKNAAKGSLAKAKKQLLHAEAECKTEKDVKKQAEAVREAREAQGYAEEAQMLAEKL